MFGLFSKKSPPVQETQKNQLCFTLKKDSFDYDRLEQCFKYSNDIWNYLVDQLHDDIGKEYGNFDLKKPLENPVDDHFYQYLVRVAKATIHKLYEELKIRKECDLSLTGPYEAADRLPTDTVLNRIEDFAYTYWQICHKATKYYPEKIFKHDFSVKSITFYSDVFKIKGDTIVFHLWDGELSFTIATALDKGISKIRISQSYSTGTKITTENKKKLATTRLSFFQ